ncbi:MAG: SAM-dependent methyltransferase [Erysipelotrichaceae bacterium]
MLYIVGLGASDELSLTLGTIKCLNSGLPLYLRTDHHPMISYLKDNDINYKSFDDTYEENDTFEAVYEYIIKTLKELSSVNDIVYAVPGHPCVAEYAVKVLMKECKCKIVGGQSFLDPMFAALEIDPIDGLMILDALDFDYKKVVPSLHLIVPQVYDQISASNLKLDLMEIYPDEHRVCLVEAAGSIDQKLTWCMLYEIDQNFELNNLTTLYVTPLTV